MSDIVKLLLKAVWDIHETVITQKKNIRKEPTRTEVFRKAVAAQIALSAILKQMGYTPMDVARAAKEYEAAGKQG